MRSLERGSSEVFYWELFVLRRPPIFPNRRIWMPLLLSLLGEDTKNQLKVIVEHERGRAMRDEEYRPLSEGAREEENPTHAPPRRVSVES